MIRRAASIAGWALVVVVGALMWPVQLGGGTGYVIVSGQSMTGTYESGDLVVTRSDARYRVGQAVVYRVPQGQPGEGLHVVHRLRAGDGDGWTTRGDALTADDPWTPTDDDVVGRVVLHVPQLGRAVGAVTTPWILALFSGVLTAAAVAAGGRRQDPDQEPVEAVAEPVA